MAPSRPRDVLVVGGGPAGLATAIFAALEGLDSAVVERRSLPADKSCGEGLMPGGVALLERMGVRLRVGHPLLGIRYLDGEHEVEGSFRAGPGLGVRRTELSRALAERARELGVTIEEGTRALAWESSRDGVVLQTDRGPREGRYLVAADGLRSPMRRAAGLEGRRFFGRAPRYGARRHFRLAPWASFVEVHWSEGVEAYVTPVGRDEVGVALLWCGRAAGFEELLRRFPALSSRLAGAEVTSPASGAGPLRQVVRRVTRDRLALVGDAAGYVDALTGEGVTLGFRSAEALSRALRRGSLSSYEREYWRQSRRYRWTTELLLGLTEAPRLRRAFLRLLAERPALFSRLLHFHQPANVIE